eukprot:CAMPEP_0185192368 /NCGR_PEP_ID=MMETSP1140-20130426/18197_1 /TAXON_ID=298111 /ORGANISM="Pavlova sp., Strain CCMP459" /LENGTH=128 /DNA_ID=CAMNT_0027759113 /DNA_START=100 /DNA_END=487 /DNA_ORIENTATION=+
MRSTSLAILTIVTVAAFTSATMAERTADNNNAPATAAAERRAARAAYMRDCRQRKREREGEDADDVRGARVAARSQDLPAEEKGGVARCVECPSASASRASVDSAAGDQFRSSPTHSGHVWESSQESE